MYVAAVATEGFRNLSGRIPVTEPLGRRGPQTEIVLQVAVAA
jgi:hypothetical protein